MLNRLALKATLNVPGCAVGVIYVHPECAEFPCNIVIQLLQGGVYTDGPEYSVLAVSVPSGELCAVCEKLCSEVPVVLGVSRVQKVRKATVIEWADKEWHCHPACVSAQCVQNVIDSGASIYPVDVTTTMRLHQVCAVCHVSLGRAR